MQNNTSSTNPPARASRVYEQYLTVRHNYNESIQRLHRYVFNNAGHDRDILIQFNDEIKECSKEIRAILGRIRSDRNRNLPFQSFVPSLGLGATGAVAAAAFPIALQSGAGLAISACLVAIAVVGFSLAVCVSPPYRAMMDEKQLVEVEAQMTALCQDFGNYRAMADVVTNLGVEPFLLPDLE